MTGKWGSCMPDSCTGDICRASLCCASSSSRSSCRTSFDPSLHPAALSLTAPSSSSSSSFASSSFDSPCPWDRDYFHRHRNHHWGALAWAWEWVAGTWASCKLGVEATAAAAVVVATTWAWEAGLRLSGMRHQHLPSSSSSFRASFWTDQESWVTAEASICKSELLGMVTAVVCSFPLLPPPRPSPPPRSHRTVFRSPLMLLLTCSPQPMPADR